MIVTVPIEEERGQRVGETGDGRGEKAWKAHGCGGRLISLPRVRVARGVEGEKSQHRLVRNAMQTTKSQHSTASSKDRKMRTTKEREAEPETEAEAAISNQRNQKEPNKNKEPKSQRAVAIDSEADIPMLSLLKSSVTVQRYVLRAGARNVLLATSSRYSRSLDIMMSPSLVSAAPSQLQRNYTATALKKLHVSSTALLDDADVTDGPARIYREMSPNRTVQSFEGESTTSSSSSSFEYDYDEDNLHMPVSQTTSMDYEDNTGCDSLGMDDVMDIREARRAWDSDMEALHLAEEEGTDCDGVGESEEDWYTSSADAADGGEGFVEMEEDWEILHERAHAADGAGAKADDDGDVVIDW